MKECKLRIEDALNATRAAVEEGIVPGGGVALLNVIPAVKALAAKAEGDDKTGVNIVLRALEEPVRQIAINAGVDGSVVVENVKRSKKAGYGYDAKLDEYGDDDRPRHHRPHQGHPQRAAERGQHSGHGAHHRKPGLRHSRSRARGSRARCRRNGRHVLRETLKQRL